MDDATAPDAGRPAHVLVAEDHPVNRVVAQAMLASLGVSCTLAEDGGEAVECAAVVELDLVLMDLHMPGLDGLEATRQLRANAEAAGRPRVPVVAMTGGDEAVDGPDCRAAGMDGFLAKPFTLEALRACLLQHGVRCASAG
ncbi:response regulator [Ideonella oryzae]|uniref:Response regulator n=1 Tax=Ideonella oryzae TaxID=2937441 RepID=A0ABT1BQN6_9BURK|nr:response regulator [Ideonella oryzae]MCO5977846.1 response regulator [Ideonella oryzae]